MRVNVRAVALLTTASAALSFAMPAMAQDNQDDNSEIIVTARRVEERLQDVPASITVFNQEQLDNLNATNLGDLGRYTPGLYANNRFGDDNSTFAIRGFTQELRTTASVGVYFADVVAPRGGGAISGGDGAGPGSLFDLQNVQVLRGPQGTLFGRNTTGGAVLLVPRRPSDEYEGYVEGSLGDFDMSRVQAVLNAPFTDTLRFRIGVDHQERDGYLDNVGVGPDLADVDYTAARASLIWDILPNLENYTILTYTDSENNGTISQVFDCNFPSLNPVGVMCDSAGQSDAPANFYEVNSFQPNTYSNIEQWQFINTTTWTVNDNLTVKNIFALSSYELALQGGVFGTNFNIASLTGGASTNPFYFANAGAHPFGPAIATDGLVEEVQFQGRAINNRLNWQAGLYYEHTEPDGTYGQQSISNLSCDIGTTGDANPANFLCDDWLGSLTSGALAGLIIRQAGMIEYENMAAYAQGTFDVTDQIALTLGLRYTDDKTDAISEQYIWYFDDNPAPGNQFVSDLTFDPPSSVACADPGLTTTGGVSGIEAVPGDCRRSISAESDAVTWVAGLDYRPMEDLLLYLKYSRGYRQGGVVPYAIPGLQTYEPEEVDTYEIGMKAAFGGPVPGVFNVALFYNDFRDQQIQAGLLPTTGSGTTAIVNAGSSTIQGAEIDTRVELFDGFTLSFAYTYLDTEVEEFNPPTLDAIFGTGGPAPDCPNNPASSLQRCPTYSVAVGQPLPYSPEHQFSLTAAYELPTPENFGDITVAATYNYTDEQQAFAQGQAGGSPWYLLPSYEVLNFNVTWDRILGSPVDGSLFVTNALDEEYWTFVSGVYAAGFEARTLGQPMMAGVRLRYNFGGG